MDSHFLNAKVRNFACHVYLIALLVGKAVANSNGNFTNPPAFGAVGEYADDVIWPLYSVREVNWVSAFNAVDLYLFKDRTGGSCPLQSNADCVLLDSNNDQAFYQWNVSYTGLPLNNAPIFYFSAYQAGTGSLHFSSHYFNISAQSTTSSTSSSTSSTTSSSTSSSTSSGSTTSAKTSATSTGSLSSSTNSAQASSSAKSAGGLSSGAKVGLGVGIPLGLIIVGMGLYLFWYRNRKSRGSNRETISSRDLPEMDKAPLKASTPPVQNTTTAIDKTPVTANHLAELDSNGHRYELGG